VNVNVNATFDVDVGVAVVGVRFRRNRYGRMGIDRSVSDNVQVNGERRLVESGEP
jgi:hypothetical protein